MGQADVRQTDRQTDRQTHGSLNRWRIEGEKDKEKKLRMWENKVKKLRKKYFLSTKYLDIRGQF